MSRKLARIKPLNLAFIAVVPLLTATSIITAPCPVCHGTGVLATAPGMENVEITEYDTNEWRITREACGLYILYFYDIEITLFNKGEQPVDGWLKLSLVDISKEGQTPVIDTQYRPVELAGLSGKELSFTIVFGTGIEAWGQTEVRIEIMTGDVSDATCDGSGRVPSNTWLFINGLKERFVQTIQNEFEYNPPEVIDWEDYPAFNG